MPDHPEQQPLGPLQNLISAARAGQAEPPQSERRSYQPDALSAQDAPAAMLHAVLDALDARPWPGSAEDLRAMLAAMGYTRTKTAGQREDWGLEGHPAHLYVFPKEGVTFLEVVLAQDEANPDPAAPRARAMGEAYTAALTDARSRLGDPAFEGAFGDDGFPEDDDAVRLALWRRGETRVSLQQKDDGPDFPMRLLCVIEPTGEA